MEENLQKKILLYQVLQSRLETLGKQREIVFSKIWEIENTIKAIEEVEKSGNILFPLGSEAFVEGEAKDKQNFILKIGANVALKKSKEESINFLKEKKEKLEKSLLQIESEMNNILNKLSELAPEIQKLLKKQ